MKTFGPHLFGKVAYARRLGVGVGKGCRIYITEFGTEPFLITIGDNVTITGGVTLITHDGSSWLLREADGTRYQRYAPITIGDDVFIGANAILLPGVTVGSKVVIGAGAVVTRDIPSGLVVAGNPARPIKPFEAFEAKMKEAGVLDDSRFESLGYEDRVRAMIAHSARE